MSRHESSGLEIAFGLLFSAALAMYKIALFTARTISRYQNSNPGAKK